MEDEKYKLRQELWNKFINNKDGIKASDLVSQLDSIHDLVILFIRVVLEDSNI